MLKMIRNIAFAHRSQHVQFGRFNTEEEVRVPSHLCVLRCKLLTTLLCAGHQLRARALPLAAHDGLHSCGIVHDCRLSLHS